MANPRDRRARPKRAGTGADPGFAPAPVSRNGNSPDPTGGAPVRYKRQRTPVFNLFLILAAAAVVVPVVIVAFAFVLGLGPFASDLFPVNIHNDGPAAVVIKDCGTNCTATDEPYTLLPGKAVSVAASDRGLVTFYLHDPSTGQVTGCLPLEFHAKVSGAAFDTSQAEACPGSPLTAR